jgi:hypothetical protein
MVTTVGEMPVACEKDIVPVTPNISNLAIALKGPSAGAAGCSAGIDGKLGFGAGVAGTDASTQKAQVLRQAACMKV